jgi:hypothetical protein
MVSPKSLEVNVTFLSICPRKEEVQAQQGEVTYSRPHSKGGKPRPGLLAGPFPYATLPPGLFLGLSRSRKSPGQTSQALSLSIHSCNLASLPSVSQVHGTSPLPLLTLSAVRRPSLPPRSWARRVVPSPVDTSHCVTVGS